VQKLKIKQLSGNYTLAWQIIACGILEVSNLFLFRRPGN
jgi:hypothetical protein